MGRRFVGAGLAALMAALGLAAAAAAQNAAAPGADIIPGQAVGGYRLGQNVGPLLSTLGPIRSQDDLPDTTLTAYFWPLRRIAVIADKSSGTIVALGVSLDDTFTTDKGVGAGTELDAVRSAYGKEDLLDDHEDDQTLVYNNLGVAFVVDKSGALSGRVSVIFVFANGHYRDIFKEHAAPSNQ